MALGRHHAVFEAAPLGARPLAGFPLRRGPSLLRKPMQQIEAYRAREEHRQNMEQRQGLKG
jgi:hypothetical protein